MYGQSIAKKEDKMKDKMTMRIRNSTLKKLYKIRANNGFLTKSVLDGQCLRGSSSDAFLMWSTWFLSFFFHFFFSSNQFFRPPRLFIEDVHCGQYHFPLGGAVIPTHG